MSIKEKTHMLNRYVAIKVLKKEYKRRCRILSVNSILKPRQQQDC